MTVNKRKKNSRQRGSWTHGWGAKKKHRGKGNKGGAGMAGTGKRGDSKKPMIWKNKEYFGKYGFKKKNIIREVIPVNLLEIEKKADRLVAENKIKKQGDVYVIDVEKLGYNKVLGYGKPGKKFKISSPSFSKEAAEKIKAAGGEIILTKKEKKAELTETKKTEEPVSMEK
jgi:large subunit ribosomal protein L15